MIYSHADSFFKKLSASVNKSHQNGTIDGFDHFALKGTVFQPCYCFPIYKRLSELRLFLVSAAATWGDCPEFIRLRNACFLLCASNPHSSRCPLEHTGPRSMAALTPVRPTVDASTSQNVDEMPLNKILSKFSKLLVLCYYIWLDLFI